MGVERTEAIYLELDKKYDPINIRNNFFANNNYGIFFKDKNSDTPSVTVEGNTFFKNKKAAIQL